MHNHNNIYYAFVLLCAQIPVYQLYIVCCFTQDCHLGVDWDGPVSLNDDTETVIVPSVPSNLLNECERQVLTEHLSSHNEETFGIHSYVLARMYISSLQ